MSLIDTQAVINLIADIQYDDRYINNNEVFVALETVRDCVFNLPTAYDVEKVCEELFENIKGCHNTITIFDTKAYVRFDKAVEIVKRGGVDEQD